MIALHLRLRPSTRRLAVAAGAIALAAVVIAPLSSTDAAQQAGLPLLTDRLWFRIATTVAMFVALASAFSWCAPSPNATVVECLPRAPAKAKALPSSSNCHGESREPCVNR